MTENTDVRALLEAHVSRCVQAGSERPMWSGPSLEARDLDRMNLRSVNLEGMNLSWTVLTDTNLLGANLSRADLRDADLTGASLLGADLRGATMPDGRTLAEWQADPLAGLCDDPESVARAIAAWDGRSWLDCPLHAALGVNGLDDVQEDRRMLAATFVALLDGGHLPRPGTRPATSAQQR